MTQTIPFTTLKDFLINGKGREQGTFLPSDPDVNAIVTVLETGLEAKHLAEEAVETAQVAAGAITTPKLDDAAVTGPKLDEGALKLLVFSGMDGSVTPGACTLTGAAVDDAVVGIINLTDAAAGTTSFESAITVVNEIQQTEQADLSTKKFAVLLIAR